MISAASLYEGFTAEGGEKNITLTIVSGDNQYQVMNRLFDAPLTVEAMENGTPVENLEINFRIADMTSTARLKSSNLSGKDINVMTGPDGRASVWIFSGDENTSLEIIASADNKSVSFHCHVVMLRAVLIINGINAGREIIVLTGEPVVFDALQSKGEIVAFEMDYGDETTASVPLQGSYIHVYVEPGTYTVRLSVSDRYGLQDQVVANITVLSAGNDGKEMRSPMFPLAIEFFIILILFAIFYTFSRSVLMSTQIALHPPGIPSEGERMTRGKGRDAVYYFNRGTELISAGEHRKALWYLNRAIEMDPDMAKAYYNKGLALFHLGRYGPALSALKKARQVDPSLRGIDDVIDIIETRGNIRDR